MRSASLGLAMLLNSAAVRFRNAFRFAFSSHVVGGVFVAILFRLLMAPRQGLVNRILATLPGMGGETNWLGDPWFTAPGDRHRGTVADDRLGDDLFPRGIQAVDRELYEAAEVDERGRGAALPATSPSPASGRCWRSSC